MKKSHWGESWTSTEYRTVMDLSNLLTHCGILC